MVAALPRMLWLAAITAAAGPLQKSCSACHAYALGKFLETQKRLKLQAPGFKAERVWVDVGTSKRSSLLSDMLIYANQHEQELSNLIGIGLEISPVRWTVHEQFVNASMQALPAVASRWTQLKLAASSHCYDHRVQSFSLASDDSTERLAEVACSKMSSAASKTSCREGVVEKARSAFGNMQVVQACTLDTILAAAEEVFGPLRVEYLKTDTEGHDVEAVSGVRRFANKTDYIFVEVQDLDPSEDASTFARLAIAGSRSATLVWAKQRLRPMGFDLAYCEDNNEKLRQINCLFHRTGVDGSVCVTGRPQKLGTAETHLHSAPPCRMFKATVSHDSKGKLFARKAALSRHFLPQ